MNIYFVRHGESAGNALRLHQNHTVELSELGRQHAAGYAKRLKELSINRIVASPYVRAKQTAEIISQEIGLPIEFSDLFVEVKRPTAIEGKHINEPEVVAIKKMIEERYHDPDYRHSDEDTFALFSGRARKAKEYLNAIDAENILVVSHGDFIKMFLCVVLFGEKLEPWMYLQMRPLLEASHTGITHFKKKGDEWFLSEWNAQ